MTNASAPTSPSDDPPPAPPPPTAAPAAPAASRFRRAARFAGGHPWLTVFSLLLLVTLAARLAWGWRVGRLLAEQRDAIRSRGEPLTGADVSARRLSDDENAWTLIAQAAAADNRGSPSETNNVYPEYPPYDAA